MIVTRSFLIYLVFLFPAATRIIRCRILFSSYTNEVWTEMQMTEIPVGKIKKKKIGYIYIYIKDIISIISF